MIEIKQQKLVVFSPPVITIILIHATYGGGMAD